MRSLSTRDPCFILYVKENRVTEWIYNLVNQANITILYTWRYYMYNLRSGSIFPQASFYRILLKPVVQLMDQYLLQQPTLKQIKYTKVRNCRLWTVLQKVAITMYNNYLECLETGKPTVWGLLSSAVTSIVCNVILWTNLRTCFNL